MKTKICTKCGKRKLLKYFSKNKNLKTGVDSWCKKCKNIRSQEWRKRNKKKTQKYNREWYKKYPWKKVLDNIKIRCTNKNHKQYKDYGGRGIKCLITSEKLKKLWFRDKAYLMIIPSIDRIDNDDNYTVQNCRFIEKSLNSKRRKGKI